MDDDMTRTKERSMASVLRPLSVKYSRQQRVFDLFRHALCTTTFPATLTATNVQNDEKPNSNTDSSRTGTAESAIPSASGFLLEWLRWYSRAFTTRRHVPNNNDIFGMAYHHLANENRRVINALTNGEVFPDVQSYY